MVSETMARRGTASMAKMMGLMCVADSKLGKFREGQCPVTRTGDYSDVVVVDGDGRIIPWQRAARLDATEMGRTMREIVDKLYTFLLNMEGSGAGGAARSSTKRDLGVGQAQRGPRAEEADGGARKRHRREWTEAGCGRRRDERVTKAVLVRWRCSAGPLKDRRDARRRRGPGSV